MTHHWMGVTRGIAAHPTPPSYQEHTCSISANIPPSICHIVHRRPQAACRGLLGPRTLLPAKPLLHEGLATLKTRCMKKDNVKDTRTELGRKLGSEDGRWEDKYWTGLPNNEGSRRHAELES